MIPTERPFLASDIGLSGGNIRRLYEDGFLEPVGRIRHTRVWRATDKLRKTPQSWGCAKKIEHEATMLEVRRTPGQTIRQISERTGEAVRKTYSDIRMLELSGKVQIKNTGSLIRIYPAEETCQI